MMLSLRVPTEGGLSRSGITEGSRYVALERQKRLLELTIKWMGIKNIKNLSLRVPTEGGVSRSVLDTLHFVSLLELTMKVTIEKNK